MAKLFDINRNKIMPDANILAIPSIKKLWNRDKSVDKETALKEISYIVFLHDFHSPYRDINSSEKESLIKADIFEDKDWKPDTLIDNAIKTYIKLQKSRHSDMLKALEHTEEEITYYFNNINLRDIDEATGKPLYDINIIVRNAKELGNIIKSIAVLEKQVKLELESQSVRGDAEIGYFEDPKK